MQIGEFSKKSGISIDTLRYYDKIKLLVPQKVDGKRIYSEENLAMAEAIIMLKRLNFSLEEIKAILDLDKDIDDNTILDAESRTKANSILKFIEEKHSYVLEQEQILIEIKWNLQKMINKTKKFLDYKD